MIEKIELFLEYYKTLRYYLSIQINQENLFFYD